MTEEEQGHDDDPLVRLATAPNEMVAEWWAGTLEQDGIRCMTRPAHFSALYMGIGLSEHEVWVLSSQLERAMEVLGPLLEVD